LPRGAATLGLVAAIVLSGGCRRDPYARLRPHEALRAADELYAAGRLDEAARVYALAFTKAEAAELDRPALRIYAERLVQIAAARDRLEETEAAFERMRALGPPDVLIFPGGAHNLGVLHARRGNWREAERRLQEAARSLQTISMSDVDNGPALFVVWTALDRVRWAQGREGEAAAAFLESIRQLQRLGSFHGGHYWPLPPGMRASVVRYAAFLRRAHRDAAAAQLEETALAIDSQATAAGYTYQAAACVAYLRPAPMGCLLEFE
jgi:hypothetical protein